ncbi:CocE/NonD family hydrolase [Gemmatimonadota bacterium]
MMYKVAGWMSIVIALTAIQGITECEAQGDSRYSASAVMIPMRDGVELATWLFTPTDGNGPWPVILTRTPYGRSTARAYGPRYAAEGYVVAIQDVRGQYDSEGEFVLWLDDRADGYDSVEWLAAQEWSTGKVGMLGGSHLGYTNMAAAVAKPPHLVTFISIMTQGDPFHIHVRPHGMFPLQQHFLVLNLFSFDYAATPRIPMLPDDWVPRLSHLPVIDLDGDILGVELPMWRDHVTHSTFDDYWEPTGVHEGLEGLDIPAMFIGGWFDFGGAATLHSWRHLQQSGSPARLLIGPWTHQEPGVDRMGGMYMGSEASVDLDALYLRWFDHHLKGRDTGMMDEPPVEVFAIGKNRWLKCDEYPLPETEWMPFYLSSETGANTSKGDGRLSRQLTDSGGEFDTYICDPGDPTPSLWFGAGLDYDRRLLEREDILVFETGPLSDSLMVAGPISMRIFASSTAPDTDWIAYWRVFDGETGQPALMGRGVLRASYRNSSRSPEPIEPGEVYEYSLDMVHMGVFLPAGSVIRVEIASAGYPDWSRNLQTGEVSELGSEYVSAEQRIWHTAEYPSRLILPVVDLDGFSREK